MDFAIVYIKKNIRVLAAVQTEVWLRGFLEDPGGIHVACWKKVLAGLPSWGVGVGEGGGRWKMGQVVPKTSRK